MLITPAFNFLPTWCISLCFIDSYKILNAALPWTEKYCPVTEVFFMYFCSSEQGWYFDDTCPIFWNKYYDFSPYLELLFLLLILLTLNTPPVTEKSNSCCVLSVCLYHIASDNPLWCTRKHLHKEYFFQNDLAVHRKKIAEVKAWLSSTIHHSNSTLHGKGVCELKNTLIWGWIPFGVFEILS